MSDGFWSGGVNQEKTSQVRKDAHRPLRVNVSSLGNLNAGDASSYASENPNSSTGFIQGGPHYMLSPETPDESHTYGFEFLLVTSCFPPAERIGVPVGGVDVTVWQLIGNSQFNDPAAPVIPVWGSFEPLTGVQMTELYHSFDCNACAIRFQISGTSDDVVGGSVMIYMREL